MKLSEHIQITLGRHSSKNLHKTGYQGKFTVICGFFQISNCLYYNIFVVPFRYDIAEILLKVSLKHQKSYKNVFQLELRIGLFIYLKFGHRISPI
jgi:hypothetical protein